MTARIAWSSIVAGAMSSAERTQLEEGTESPQGRDRCLKSPRDVLRIAKEWEEKLHKQKAVSHF